MNTETRQQIETQTQNANKDMGEFFAMFLVLAFVGAFIFAKVVDKMKKK